MKLTRISCLTCFLYGLASAAVAGLPPIGAAPTGDPTIIASRIIKHDFPTCAHVTSALRMPDGSIRAVCDGTRYLVFTLLNAREGKTLELALNCAAAKEDLHVTC